MLNKYATSVRKAIAAMVALCLVASSGTTALAYYEKDPRLEYIRTGTSLLNQFPATFTAVSNVNNFVGLTYIETGSTDDRTVNGDRFVEEATYLCLQVINFETDGVRTSGMVDSTNRILQISAAMELLSGEQYLEADRLAGEVAEQIRAVAATPREMVEAANQYLIDHVSYPRLVDENNPTLWSAYGALAKGEAVCQGYAMAFNLIMNKLAIPVINVYGIGDGEDHVWNQVLVDGEWLLVDVTFNDPVISGGRPSRSELAEWNREFLLLTEEEFYGKRIHVADTGFSPETAKEAFYRNRVEQQAVRLADEGLFSGDARGFRLADGLTRAEMAVMLARVNGGMQDIKENSAHYTAICKQAFTDVPDWAKPYVGYCYEKGLVVGMGGRKYGSKIMASKLDYCAVLLRADGISTGYTYRTSDVKAVEQGYLSLTRAAFPDLTRGDVAAMTYGFYGL